MKLLILVICSSNICKYIDFQLFHQQRMYRRESSMLSREKMTACIQGTVRKSSVPKSLIDDNFDKEPVESILEEE